MEVENLPIQCALHRTVAKSQKTKYFKSYENRSPWDKLNILKDGRLQ
jgi:hypothetical protein